MTRGPGWLFVAGLLVFALLGLLAAAPPSNGPPETPVVAERNATDVSPTGRVQPAPRPVDRVSTRSAESLARAWGELTANWTPRSLPARLRSMAASAAPALAADLERALDAAPGEVLATGGGSRGLVEAVDVRGAGGSRRLIVVTRERPVAADDQLAIERYRVYVGVALRLDASEWRMARWQRQP